MLLRLLKNNRAGGVLFIGILVALLWAASLVHPLPADSGYGMPFYLVLERMTAGAPFASAILALIVNLAIAFLLVRLNISYFLIDDRSYMPATFYLLVATANPELHHLSPVLIGSLFLLIALFILFNASDDRPDSLRLFNASLILVAGSLFYMKLIWFVPFIWFTIGYFRPIRWREVLYPITAYAMLLLFLITYYWVLKDNPAGMIELLEKTLAFHPHKPHFETPWVISYGWLLFLIILASGYIVRGFQSGKIIVRKIYQVFFVMFLFSIVFYLLIAPFDKDAIILAAIPVSYLLANYFHQRRTRWYHEILLWIWLGTIVYMQLHAHQIV
jgi:hypothetical protein